MSAFSASVIIGISTMMDKELGIDSISVAEQCSLKAVSTGFAPQVAQPGMLRLPPCVTGMPSLASDSVHHSRNIAPFRGHRIVSRISSPNHPPPLLVQGLDQITAPKKDRVYVCQKSNPRDGVPLSGRHRPLIPDI